MKTNQKLWEKCKRKIEEERRKNLKKRLAKMKISLEDQRLNFYQQNSRQKGNYISRTLHRST